MYCPSNEDSPFDWLAEDFYERRRGKRMGQDKQPVTLGRFNYLTVREDLYNVLFFPFRGPMAAVIARNLDKQTAFDLCTELNAGIDNARHDFEDWDGNEY